MGRREYVWGREQFHSHLIGAFGRSLGRHDRAEGGNGEEDVFGEHLDCSIDREVEERE